MLPGRFSETYHKQTFICQRGEIQVDFLCLPCHIQAVERAVETVAEASGTLCTSLCNAKLCPSLLARRILKLFKK